MKFVCMLLLVFLASLSFTEAAWSCETGCFCKQIDKCRDDLFSTPTYKQSCHPLKNGRDFLCGKLLNESV